MLVSKFRCPNCSATVRVGATTKVGQVIACPKCDHPFRLRGPSQEAQPPEDDEWTVDRGDLTKGKPTPTGKRGMAEADSGRQERRFRSKEREEEPEDEERRCARQHPRKGRQPKHGPSLALLGLIGGLTLVFVIGGGLGLYFILRKDRPSGSTALTSQPTEKTPPGIKTGWKEISSAEGRFKAVMPIGTVERTRTMPSQVGPVTDQVFLYELEGEIISYALSYADFSEDQLRGTSLEKVIDSGRNATLKTFHGELEGDRTIDRHGRREREVTIRLPGRGYILLRYYIDGSRLYTLTAAGSKAAPDSEDVQTFFNSFQIGRAKE